MYSSMSILNEVCVCVCMCALYAPMCVQVNKYAMCRGGGQRWIVCLTPSLSVLDPWDSLSLSLSEPEVGWKPASLSSSYLSSVSALRSQAQIRLHFAFHRTSVDLNLGFPNFTINTEPSTLLLWSPFIVSLWWHSHWIS